MCVWGGGVEKRNENGSGAVFFLFLFLDLYCLCWTMNLPSAMKTDSIN